MKISVRNLAKSFGDREIWKGIDYDFTSDSIISIAGKSGQGKTTFLRCLNGLETYDEGTITFDDELMPVGKTDAEKIGMVFQGYHLFPKLTVWENILLAPLYHGVEKSVAEKRALQLLKDLDIEDEKDKYPRNLSGGQQQRVAIVRACMLEPDILCFDEPTSALDADTIDKLAQIMETLKAKGMGMIVVTHDRAFAERVSDRILHFEEGNLREENLKAI
ncbi:putative arginine ABC transporter, ATP-binding protein ArtM [Aedoeadaptatus nemausensis]|uniref:Putative arginine ABC transporter, ATP-binding protein ArtM n=1 Tax=Aedoeadaptatus nemausensis TaxID=2582829 RepID=A0A6V6XYJ9_9FIRM|nr:ATP-binding cassette domain-containing protein [Peptoniphilus nemausensis]CAC9922270.1 putative arginine ABC transporter, ATP-binding protein ArtM [Peptoniphilus nemausensis]